MNRLPAPPRSAARLLAVSVMSALTLAACATGPGASPSPQGEIGHPHGGALVLRLEQRGGFVPVEYHLTRLPTLSLLGDGRVIVTGAVPAVFPGPMLPPLLERRLTEAGMQAVLRVALESGQLDADADWQGAARFVADASDDVFILVTGGRRVTVSVYALGIGEVGAGELSDEERAAHEALRALQERLHSLDAWLPAGSWADSEWRPYEPDALRLLVRLADADPPVEDGMAHRAERWPVPGDPADFGEPTELEGWRCGVVGGAEAEAWYAALLEADQLTRWIGEGHRYQVMPRPLLPDERSDCAPLR